MASDNIDRNDIFANYDRNPAFYDEMFDDTGNPHPHSQGLWDALRKLTPEQIMALQKRAEHSFLYEGITFAVYSDDEAQERIIPIDCLPRILDALSWKHIEDGLKQRLHALNLFLADVYGAGKIFRDDVIPLDLVRGCPQYRIEMQGVAPRLGVYVAVCGTDIIRTHDGFMVLEDNLRVPSGVSYMLANRRAVRTSLRNTFRRHKVRSVRHYGRELFKTLCELAPPGVTDPASPC